MVRYVGVGTLTTKGKKGKRKKGAGAEESVIVGVAFEDSVGEHDGVGANGERYFICGKKKGICVAPHLVTITPSFGEWHEAEQVSSDIYILWSDINPPTCS